MTYIPNPVRFVAGGNYITRAVLFATYPANATRLGMFANVNDLYGSIRSVMACEFDGSAYYWKPMRTDYAITSTQSTGTFNFTPKLSAPTTIMQTNLAGNMTIALGTANAWPGCQCTVYTPSSLGLSTLQFTGLIGGLTKLLLGGGGPYVASYTSAGWRA